MLCMFTCLFRRLLDSSLNIIKTMELKVLFPLFNNGMHSIMYCIYALYIRLYVCINDSYRLCMRKINHRVEEKLLFIMLSIYYLRKCCVVFHLLITFTFASMQKGIRMYCMYRRPFISSQNDGPHPEILLVRAYLRGGTGSDRKQPEPTAAEESHVSLFPQMKDCRGRAPC